MSRCLARSAEATPSGFRIQIRHTPRFNAETLNARLAFLEMAFHWTHGIRGLTTHPNRSPAVRMRKPNNCVEVIEMRWYEKAVYEVGHFFINAAHKVGNAMCRWAVIQQWKRDQQLRGGGEQ